MCEERFSRDSSEFANWNGEQQFCNYCREAAGRKMQGL